AVYAVPYTTVVSRANKPISTATDTISILPLGSRETSIFVPNTNIFTTEDLKVETQINGQVFTDQINVKSFISQHAKFLAISAIVVGAVIAAAALSWRLLVPRKKR